MSTSTRVTRSKGESDGLRLPMRMRPSRRDAASGRNGGTALSTSGWEHQQQMPTQMPHLTQSPEVQSAFYPNYAKNFLPVSLSLGYSVAACICCPKCALVLGNGSERFCASRPLLGSYVHQEPI